MDGERSLPPEAALSLAAQEIRRLGLDLTVRREGSPDLPIYVSELTAAGKLLATGSGKGNGAQARASSDFEALERFFTVFRGNTRYRGAQHGDEPQILPLPSIADQLPMLADRAVQRWAAEFPDHVAACARYGGSSGEIYYPLFLNDPHYVADPIPGDDPDPYRSMLRYTSSIGTASGAASVDARLHGLCELVEHDSISHALLRWFVVRDTRLDLVEPVTLPSPLRSLHERAAAVLGAPVLLADITTDLEIPAYLAICETPTRSTGLYGSGASPSGACAVERALHEVVQSAVAYDEVVARRNTRRLSRWPALHDCLHLSAARLLGGDARQATIAPDPPGVERPTQRLAWLDAQLARNGIETFARELTPVESLISVVATVAPALDRFSMVLLGMPVVPTGRAWRLWEQAQRAASEGVDHVETTRARAAAERSAVG